MTTSQSNPTAASSDQMQAHPTRDELAAMTYEEWIAYHRSQPGGWLTTAAPEEVLRSCYADRLATFDAAEADAPDAVSAADSDDTDQETFS